MSEGGDDKPKDDRSATLRRKLAGGRSGALGKHSTGPQTPTALKREGDPSSQRDPQPPSSLPEKDAILASRRASLITDRPPPPTVRAKPVKLGDRKTRPIFLALGGVLLAGLLAAGAIFGKLMLDARTPQGQMRAVLMNWEFALSPGERDGIWSTLDKEAPSSLSRAIELLTDSSLPERSDSKSERSMQQLAHLWLMHYAAVVKTPPPPAAVELAARQRDGQQVTPAMWTAARDGWTKWVSEQQSKGTVPK